MVRPGGTLVYSVCTLTLAESVGVVDSARTSLVGLGFRSVDPGGDGWTTLGDGVEVLLPGPAHDGMCRAVFERA